MPNFNIVVGSQFNPFTYDELIRPIQEQQSLHNQLEEKYADMQAKADIWKNMINETVDKKAAKQFKAYLDDLNKSVDALMSEGLNPNSRRKLFEMNRRYASEIAPIENAYNTRKAQIAEQLAGRAKGMVYNYDAATTSLDEYLNNPSKTYKSADSNIGLNRVSAQVQNYVNNLQKIAKGDNTVDAYTKTILEKSGYDLSDVNNAVRQAMADVQNVINGNAGITDAAGSAVRTIMQNEAKASGISEWGNKAAQNDYMNRMIPALSGLAGTTKITTTNDQAALAELQNRMYQQRHSTNPEDFFEIMGIEQQKDGSFTLNGESVETSKVNEMLANYTTKGKGSKGSSGSGTVKDPLSNYSKSYQGLGYMYNNNGIYTKNGEVYTYDQIRDEVVNNASKSNKTASSKPVSFGVNTDGSEITDVNALIKDNKTPSFAVTPHFEKDGSIEFKSEDGYVLFTIDKYNNIANNDATLKDKKIMSRNGWFTNDYGITNETSQSIAKRIREAKKRGDSYIYRVTSDGKLYGIPGNSNGSKSAEDAGSAEDVFEKLSEMPGTKSTNNGIYTLVPDGEQ